MLSLGRRRHPNNTPQASTLARADSGRPFVFLENESHAQNPALVGFARSGGAALGFGPRWRKTTW